MNIGRYENSNVDDRIKSIVATILGILIVGDLVSLINKEYKVTGIISIVLAILILLIGIITPVSIVVCTIGAIIWAGFGVFSVLKDMKKKEKFVS